MTLYVIYHPQRGEYLANNRWTRGNDWVAKHPRTFTTMSAAKQALNALPPQDSRIEIVVLTVQHSEVVYWLDPSESTASQNWPR